VEKGKEPRKQRAQGYSAKTLYRCKKACLDMEKKGFFGVFKYFEVLAQRVGKATEEVVPVLAEEKEPSGDKDSQGKCIKNNTDQIGQGQDMDIKHIQGWATEDAESMPAQETDPQDS
jgi:hypothetical protein